VAAVMALAASSAGQEPVFRLQVEAVRVDVSVSHKGVPVTGLGPADFEVRDNGVRQAIHSVFVENVPLDVVLLLDASRSTAGERLQRLKEAATRLLTTLRPGDQAALMTFAHRVTIRQRLTPDLASVARAVAVIDADGQTSLHDAVFAASLMPHERERRFVIILFSDGGDSSSWLYSVQRDHGTRRSDAIIYAVAELPDSGSSAYVTAKYELGALASSSGGKVWWAPEPGKFGEAFARVLQDITTRYVLTCQPEGAGNKAWHTLKVKLTRRSGDVVARPGYYRR
jgi:VWFA-related protein